ncbi:MAG: copper(I)-binding protein [Glaciecola sp.]|jgi:copper(I)-binding protein|uniref:copper chaperone PCu(A)C n=1 Tax=Congregibacter sp. TaxID=2744308 RepID=UPI0039E6FF3A
MIDVRVPLVAFFSVLSLSALAEIPEISNAWVRAMPPGQRMTAAYLELYNPGATTVSILGASSEVGMASLHETRLEGGRSSMKAVDSLGIASGEVIAMEPGGLHIMLMGLETTPVEGDTVPICLQTSEGEVCADALVQRAAPEARSSHDHH